ncbi:hypothetical protein PCASD_23100 [Puccinia coronata f. sp. avenae]|uniref:Uncharacterized protein n=1 Tax=Puccinia coronata f. sp. avenae TaxID=200324 RepID=A0A2N5SCJ2_9BASI|nr:hypothetical protein PCASD_23100 [Puccinia coronata f. sp. avenae]
MFIDNFSRSTTCKPRPYRPISASNSPESYIATRPFLQNYDQSICQSLLQLAATKPLLPMELHELLVDENCLLVLSKEDQLSSDSTVFHKTTSLFSWLKPLVYPSPPSLLTERIVLYITVSHSRNEKDLFLEGLPRATYLEEREKLPDSLSNQQIALVYSTNKPPPPPQTSSKSSHHALSIGWDKAVATAPAREQQRSNSVQEKPPELQSTTVPATTAAAAVSCPIADGATTRPTTVLQVGTALTEQKNHHMESYYHH